MTDPFRLVIVDLFCGGGGFSTGMVSALLDHFDDVISAETGVPREEIEERHPAVQDWLADNVLLVAVNHDEHAVATYEANHPWAIVYEAKVQNLHPPQAVTVEHEGEEIIVRPDIVIGGPSCIPWSKANNGMAKDNQLRMAPDHVKHWLELLLPKQFLLENVEGLLKWGPTVWEDGEPRMIKDGSLFERWVGDLRAIGYTVEWDTFYAHDYGDAQSRKRLFVMGRLDYEPQWPEPTHSEDGAGVTDPYRPAADVIDWTDPGMSLWRRDRDHPNVHTTLKYTTMRRVAEGIRRHCADELSPFADALDRIGRVNPETDDVDPEAFVDVTELRADAVPIEEAAEAAAERDDPFLVEGPALEVGQEALEERYGLCVPYLLGQHGGSVARDATEKPVQSIATKGYISLTTAEPFVLPRNGRQRDEFSNGTRDPEERPLHTVTAHNHDGWLVSPYLVPFYGERENQSPRTHDVEEPLPNVPASAIKQAAVSPYLVVYNGASNCADIEAPMPTATATDRLALVVPEAFPWGLDLRFRLLKPSELAMAQGFPPDYEFVTDTKRQHTKLIGNAVPVNLAESMCRTLLEPTDTPTLNNFGDGPRPAAEGVVSDDD